MNADTLRTKHESLTVEVPWKSKSSMQGTTTPSSKFSPEREYSRRWYKKTTVKKLYRKSGEKKENISASRSAYATSTQRSPEPKPTLHKLSTTKKKDLGREKERDWECNRRKSCYPKRSKTRDVDVEYAPWFGEYVKCEVRSVKRKSNKFGVCSSLWRKIYSIVLKFYTSTGIVTQQ